MSKVGRYTYDKSDRKGKKLMTVVDGKKVHFGQADAQHYKDKTGLLKKSLNHGDKKRRDSFNARHKCSEKKSAKSPQYHACKVLW